MQHILVSACLLGEAVRYNGTDRRSDDPILKRWLAEGRVVPVCPEIAAGAPVPRPPSEIAGDGGGAGVLAGTARVIEPDGHDVTDLFLAGADQQTIPRQMWNGIREAISPAILSVATILVVISIGLLAAVELLRRRGERLRGVTPH